MNMFYSGLGIARSLGEHGIPVIGLSSQPRIYGNYTRYAKIRFCPDSRNEPEALLKFMLQFGEEMGCRSVIFPTRDDDVLFLDRYRRELEPMFILTVPPSGVVEACLSKWETYLWAKRARVTTPKCWQVENEAELRKILDDLPYPCVAKPVATHHWRRGANWELVGSRKAIGISSPEELLAEYASVGRADHRLLIQEMVPGTDDNLVIAACYLNRDSKFVAGFNTRKLVQIPQGFGTGCVVQAAHHPELFETTARLLETMRFTGIAEVEYKWDAARQEYQLIEINPRPWDQHRLGPTSGVDLIYLAYCEHAGLPQPVIQTRPSTAKWIAEDVFLFNALQLFWKRDPLFGELLRLARGKRTYAIWSKRDPLPSLVYMTTVFVPYLVRLGWQKLCSLFRKSASQANRTATGESLNREHLEKGKNHV